MQFNELEVIQEDNKRWYVTPEGKQYPSITTVLGHHKKHIIQEWRQRIGEKEANKISTQASRRGTNVHKLCEDFINNYEGYLGEHLPSNIELFNSISEILNTNITKVYGQEVPLYSDYLGVAGRTDCIADWNGRRAVIDFKTSSKTKKREWITDYFKQTTAYAIMFEERTGLPITNLVIVIAVENNRPQIFEGKRDDYVKSLKIDIKEYADAT
jgi:genome maintenance exonuclease 1